MNEIEVAAIEAELVQWGQQRRGSDAQRDSLVRMAVLAGISKHRIYVLTGIARTTIDRILSLDELQEQAQMSNDNQMQAAMLNLADTSSNDIGHGWQREGETATWISPIDKEHGIGDVMQMSLHRWPDGPKLRISVASGYEPGVDVSDLIDGVGWSADLPADALPTLFTLIGFAMDNAKIAAKLNKQIGGPDGQVIEP